MSDNWKDYKDWKELLESTKPRRDEEEYLVDDDTSNIEDVFQEYIG